MDDCKSNPVDWLMTWYRSQCDGDWEHQNGVRIETLDNPGWSLEADIAEVDLEHKVLPSTLIERSDDDWVLVEVKDGLFRADGGPCNLREMIEIFAAFVGGRLALP